MWLRCFGTRWKRRCKASTHRLNPPLRVQIDALKVLQALPLEGLQALSVFKGAVTTTDTCSVSRVWPVMPPRCTKPMKVTSVQGFQCSRAVGTWFKSSPPVQWSRSVGRYKLGCVPLRALVSAIRRRTEPACTSRALWLLGHRKPWRTHWAARTRGSGKGQVQAGS